MTESRREEQSPASIILQRIRDEEVFRGSDPKEIRFRIARSGSQSRSFALFRSDASIMHFVSPGSLGNQSEANARFLLSKITKLLLEHEDQAVKSSALKVDSHLHNLVRQEPAFF